MKILSFRVDVNKEQQNYSNQLSEELVSFFKFLLWRDSEGDVSSNSPSSEHQRTSALITGGGGGLLPEKLGGGVRQASWNP